LNQAAKGMVDISRKVDLIPEPTDSRILSAVDPSISGHQEEWRSEIMGWAPAIATPVPRASRMRIRMTMASLFALIIVMMYVIWRSQMLLVDLPPPNSSWAAEDAGFDPLHERGLDGSGVKVCMVDTGISLQHPDLEHLRIGFRDFIDDSVQPVDHGGLTHGTMMAGVLVADGHVQGVAQGVTLSMAAALSADGGGENTGDEAIVAQAIEWCWRTQKADIISLSLGGERSGATAEGSSSSIVEQATAEGVFVIAAAGNDGGLNDDGFVAAPSNVPLAISVAAHDEAGNVWSGSSEGNQQDRSNPNLKPEVMAPGVNIISTGGDDEYYSSTGTSDSTVFVAGALALILQEHPQLKRTGNSSCIELVKNALMESAQQVSQVQGHGGNTGYGSLHADYWLNQLGNNPIC